MSIAIAPGVYRHYKGTHYRVIGTGLHTETEEPLVLYYQCDDPGKMWARPAAMFAETVLIDGQAQPRFTLIQEKEFEGDGHDSSR